MVGRFNVIVGAMERSVGVFAQGVGEQTIKGIATLLWVRARGNVAKICGYGGYYGIYIYTTI